MPDDNRFAGIGDQIDDPGDESTDDAGTAAEQAETGTADGHADTGSEETGPAESGGPAFAFDETSAKSLYVRDGTLALFEDTEFEVEAALRSDHAIRDLTSREFHDALVHVAADHVEEIAARIDAERAGDD